MNEDLTALLTFLGGVIVGAVVLFVVLYVLAGGPL